MTNCTITSDEINYLIYRYLVESGKKKKYKLKKKTMNN